MSELYYVRTRGVLIPCCSRESALGWVDYILNQKHWECSVERIELREAA